MAIALTLSELARLVDGNIVRGGLDLSLTGVAALDAAGPREAGFFSNDKYRSQFLQTQAGAVIAPLGETGGQETTALVTAENPSLAFAKVVRHFAAAAKIFEPGIHPRSVVEPSVIFDPEKVRVHAGAVIMGGAKIGDGSEIGPNAVIGEGAIVGNDCRISANVTVCDRCTLGDRVTLQPGCVIGADGFGYEFVGGKHLKIEQVGIVEIGDDVEIGANTTIDRARFGKTRIGAGSKIDNLVQIGHNVLIGDHCLIISQSGIAGSTKLENHVTLAAQVGVVGHVTIGSKAILTARTGVTKDIPGGLIYGGWPAIPFRDDVKYRAHLRRVPQLAERIEALEKKVSGESA